MSDNQTLSLSEAAESVGVKAVTFRRWADQHSAYLSAGAHPPVGQARRFNSRDLEVLRTVKTYRDQGISGAFINEKLAGFTFAEIDTSEIANEIGETADSTELASVDSPEGPHSIQTVVIALSSLQSQVNALQQARNEERYSRIDTVTAIGLGIGIGLVFCAILIGLAWLYGA